MTLELSQLLPLLGAVLVASVLGSVHCAGMCGGLVLFAVGADPAKTPRRIPLHVAYHAGRGIAYTFLGLMAGSIGAAVEFSGRQAGFQQTGAMLAGGAMIAFGGIALLRVVGLRAGNLPLPKRWTQLVERGHRAAFAMPATPRAWVVGLLTPLLPCGWLYAFALAAAGTGSAVFGALVLAAFWIGTLPLMVPLGAGLQFLTGPLRRRVPAITAVIVVVLGVLTTMGRISLPTMSVESDATLTSVEHVRSLNPSDLPCCNGNGTTVGASAETTEP